MAIDKHSQAALDNFNFNLFYSNSSSSQRAKILKHFETCPQLSTTQARAKYGIMSPAPRIMELRAQGYQIDTHRITERDSNGVQHRMGLYVFQGKQEVCHEDQ